MNEIDDINQLLAASGIPTRSELGQQMPQPDTGQAQPQQSDYNPELNQGLPHQPAEQDHSPPPPGLIQERQKRQSLERELEQQRTYQQMLSERVNMLNDVISGQQATRMSEATAKPLPDPNEDLQGYVTAIEEKFADTINGLQQKVDGFEQERQQAQQVDQLKRVAMSHAQEFSQQRPDFSKAYEFYRQSRASELQAQGFPPEVVVSAVDNEERNIFAAHVSAGRNVAEAIYNAAVVRGYNAGQTSPEQGQPQQSGYQPQFQQYAQPQPQQQYAPAVQAPTGVPSLQTMQSGMMQASPMHQAAMAGSAAPLTLEQIADMPEDQFMTHMSYLKDVLK